MDIREIIVSTPIAFERTVRDLQGPLANAIVGNTNAKAVKAIFLGNRNVVPPGATKLFAVAAWSHRWPILGFAVKWFCRRNAVYGTLLTTMFFSYKKTSDKLSLKVNSKQTLLSVRVCKNNQQDLQWYWCEGTCLCQIIHFAKALADGSEKLELQYEYDPHTGSLNSTGPTQINEQALLQLGTVSLPPQAISKKHIDLYAKLTCQQVAGSLTFPANCGILLHALKFVKKPELQVDFYRITVHSLEFASEHGNLLQVGAIYSQIHAQPLEQTEKGEILTVTLSTANEQGPINTSTISILVRGNLQKPANATIPTITHQNLANKKNGKSLEISMMDEDFLLQFVGLNGDYNPLHQIDGAAQLVGFRKKINPGFAVIAEIEAILRKHFGVLLRKLSALFIRPAYPGAKYLLQFSPDNTNYTYQLVMRSKPEKVIVHGNFHLLATTTNQ